MGRRVEPKPVRGVQICTPRIRRSIERLLSGQQRAVRSIAVATLPTAHSNE
jgi:hypothetical protein